MLQDSRFELKLVAFVLSFLVFYGTLGMGNTVVAWSNGGYSSDPNNPDYGTHDWIADHAMNLLPSNESGWLIGNKSAFLYGTEAPDDSGASFQGHNGYGDTSNHHNYYSGTTCTDDSAATRASEEYQKALDALKSDNYALAAWYAGAMTHYIDDVGCWAHVMSGESSTAHSDYESQVNAVTDGYSKTTFTVTFDGALETISAHDASVSLGQNTATDNGGTYTATWMNSNFNTGWSNVGQWSSAIKNRTNESLNLAANTVADVLHMLTVEANAGGVGSGGASSTMTLLEIAIAAIIVIVAVYLAVSRKRR